VVTPRYSVSVLVQTRPAFIEAAAANRSALTGFHRCSHEKLIGGKPGWPRRLDRVSRFDRAEGQR
jgi:hypothetical protein